MLSGDSAEVEQSVAEGKHKVVKRIFSRSLLH